MTLQIGPWLLLALIPYGIFIFPYFVMYFHVLVSPGRKESHLFWIFVWPEYIRYFNIATLIFFVLGIAIQNL